MEKGYIKWKDHLISYNLLSCVKFHWLSYGPHGRVQRVVGWANYVAFSMVCHLLVSTGKPVLLGGNYPVRSRQNTTRVFSMSL